MLYCIWDLDGTVIDSKHRYTAKADGTIDLKRWVEMCTPELIAKDSLLPMARLMQADYFREDTQVIVCTARVLSDSDILFFFENDILYNEMLDRPEGCTMNDADLKEIQLRLYAHSQGISWKHFSAHAIMADDNKTILTRMNEIGIKSIDAKAMNARMA